VTDVLAVILADFFKELERYDDLVDVNVHCSFHSSPPPEVTRARRITPLAEISSLLHQITAPPNELVLSPRQQFLKEPEHLIELSRPSSPPAMPEVVANSQQSSTSTPPQVSPRSPSVPQDKTRFRTFFNNKAPSLRSSKKINPLFHRRQTSETPRQNVHLSAALSSDASSLVIWSQVMISCWSITDSKWGEDVFMRSIVLAAAGKLNFAAVSQETNGYVLSLYDMETSAPFGTCMMQLPERAWSIAFSNDGLKLAVGTRSKLRIISTDDATWATSGHYWERELVHEAENRDKTRDKEKGKDKPIEHLEKVYGQTMSFSPDRSRLVVATNFHDTGQTSVLIFDTSRGHHRSPLRIFTLIKCVSLT
jgi:hypothetical protein